MNQYRNAHFHVLNKAKKVYKETMKEQILALPVFERIAVHYTVFAKTRRKFDVSNVVSVVDKFFLDALVELGRIEDDNYDFVPRIAAEYGGIDKDNPHVLIEIKELC